MTASICQWHDRNKVPSQSQIHEGIFYVVLREILTLSSCLLNSVRCRTVNCSLLDLKDPRDFTDSMLIEISKTTDKSSSFYGESGIENLRNTLFDLFLAGSETTSTTLTWAALYMVRYPEVQKKVQAELDRVVGQNRPPSLKDKPNLPYTEVSYLNQWQGRA